MVKCVRLHLRSYHRCMVLHHYAKRWSPCSWRRDILSPPAACPPCSGLLQRTPALAFSDATCAPSKMLSMQLDMLEPALSSGYCWASRPAQHGVACDTIIDGCPTYCFAGAQIISISPMPRIHIFQSYTSARRKRCVYCERNFICLLDSFSSIDTMSVKSTPTIV